MKRREVLPLLAIAGLEAAKAFPAQIKPSSEQSHIDWVAQTLTRMQTIMPGMTRQDLLKVFRTEGGLATRNQRIYISKDCPLFKSEVTFMRVDSSNNYAKEHDFLYEANEDVILTISRPFLQFSITD